jgi:hypothetical protein
MDTHRYSICLLYWHKRTNTDAGAQKNALLHAALRAAAVQQRLASQLECVALGAGQAAYTSSLRPHTLVA